MEETLSKILKCLYVLIVIMIINTIVLIAGISGNGSSKNDENQTTTEEENTEYDVSMFTSIDADGMVSAFNSSDMQVIYLGRATCGYCVQFLPTLQQAQSEFGYTTLYLDITTVSEDDLTKIIALDEEFFNEYYGSTPLILLVKDGKIVDSQVGYSDYDTFASLLTKNGFSK